MRNKLKMLAAACLWLGVAWGCEKEQCQDGVRDGKVEIPEGLTAYFEFKEGSEWIYTEIGDSSEYFARVYNHENRIGVGEERTIRCVLGKGIVTRLETNLDTMQYADPSSQIHYLLEKNVDWDSVNIMLGGFFLDIFELSFQMDHQLKGVNGTKVFVLNSLNVGQKKYENVIKLYSENGVDTLFFAPSIGLIQLKKDEKDFRLKSYTLL